MINRHESRFKESNKEHIPVSINFRAIESEQQNAIPLQDLRLPFRANQLQYMDSSSYAQLEPEKLKSLTEDCIQMNETNFSVSEID